MITFLRWIIDFVLDSKKNIYQNAIKEKIFNRSFFLDKFSLTMQIVLDFVLLDLVHRNVYVPEFFGPFYFKKLKKK